MKHKTIVNTVRIWAKNQGHDSAKGILIGAGLSPRFVEQFLAGTYKHRLYQSTLEKLKKAGALE